MRPAMNEVLHGDVVIGEGGRLVAQAPGGGRMLETGETPAGDWAVNLSREDGTLALTVGTDVATSGQMVRTLSRGGQVIVMDDAHADGYLGRPWVPIPCAPPVTFTSDTDTALYSGHMVVQHKVLAVVAQLSGPSGTSATARLRIGTTDYGTWTLTSTATVLEISERIPLDSNALPHGTGASVVMWGQRTGGTGTCTLRVRGLWGLNTRTPEEAN
jgi:hypothetical protein